MHSAQEIIDTEECHQHGVHTSTPAESSADLRKQVLAARAVQARRYAAPGSSGRHAAPARL